MLVVAIDEGEHCRMVVMGVGRGSCTSLAGGWISFCENVTGCPRRGGIAMGWSITVTTWLWTKR